YGLVRVALADFGASASPGLLTSLYMLEARTLLESERYQRDERRRRVFGLLDRAEHFAGKDRYGARELPRLDNLRGFMEYRWGDASQAMTYFSKSAQQCAALRDWECHARALQNTATRAEEMKDFAVALEAYADALNVLPPDLDPRLTADIWSNQGRLQGLAG